MTSEVVVIGGGISGLAAAVDLSNRGHSVLVLERREFLGGRAYSYRDRVIGDVVDNGQHLLMGCFEHTKRFLQMIGTMDKIGVQQRLEVTFFHPSKGFARFRCANLPSPFHLLVGVLRLKTLSLRDRLGLWRVIREASAADLTAKEWQTLTVDAWLTRCGQSEAGKKYFWHVIATAVLNQKPEVASAALFVTVLRRAFLGRRADALLMIPRAGLSEVFVDDAIRFLEAKGGQVERRAEVAKIDFRGEKIVSVQLRNGKSIRPRAVISAVPPVTLRKLLPDLNAPRIKAELSFDTPSPIVTINLWFDRVIMEEEFVSMLDSPIPWIFNKRKIFQDSRKEGDYLSCVVSGADELAKLKKDEILKITLEQISRAYPAVQRAGLLHSVVLKEKGATFFSTPDSQSARPLVKTQWRNFFLAGDWTQTGLPGTIESAVTSGFTAARLASEYLRAR